MTEEFTQILRSAFGRAQNDNPEEYPANVSCCKDRRLNCPYKNYVNYKGRHGGLPLRI